MTNPRLLLIATVLLLLWSGAGVMAQPQGGSPSKPPGPAVSEEIRTIRPGLVYTHRETADPLRIHVLTADLSNPAVSIRACLAQDAVNGVETVRSMAARTGAVAGINGDYWGYGGVPQGLTIVDGRLAIAPKHRTAFVIDKEGNPAIDIFTDEWSWKTEAVAPDGSARWIRLLNSDCNPGWLCLYNDLWGRNSRGDTVKPVTEVVFDAEKKVLEVRTDMPGIDIPKGGGVLTGRDAEGQWLAEHFKPGDRVSIDIQTTKPITGLRQAIGAGPRILKDGQFVQDPLSEFPDGEEFAADWKRSHYLAKHPRSALGLSQDRKTLILLVVEGRMPGRSIGIHQRQSADLLLEFGAWDGMDLDSGGSSTLFLDGDVVNRVSDRAKADGSGGVERKVCNALLLFHGEQSKK